MDGTPDPMIHTPHEPPLELQRKRSGEDWCTLGDQRSTPTSKEPRDGGCPRRSSGRRARWQESPRAAITVSRTTLAPCPLTKVPAPPRGRRRHTRHNDPGLQSVDLLRRHTEEQDIYIIPVKTAVVVHRTRIARKNGARQTSSLLCLGSAQCQNQCAKRCHRAGPEETTRYTPVQKVFRTSLDNMSDEAPEMQVEEPTSFWTKLRSPSAQRASRGQRALGGPFFLYAPEFCFTMPPRELGSVDHGTAREKGVRR